MRHVPDTNAYCLVLPLRGIFMVRESQASYRSVRADQVELIDDFVYLHAALRYAPLLMTHHNVYCSII